LAPHKCRTPRGPTIAFRIHSYSLIRDVVGTQQRPRVPQAMWLGPPLVVLNNFGGEEHMKLAALTFQNLFPAINVQTTRLSACQVRRGSCWHQTLACRLAVTCAPRRCMPASSCFADWLPNMASIALSWWLDLYICLPPRPSLVLTCLALRLQRVMLLDHDKETGRISLRHYSIAVAPSGVRCAQTGQ
jgi:hypothetical protein